MRPEREQQCEPDNAAITRWTTVVLHPDELGWLREALELNTNDEPADDEPDPLWPPRRPALPRITASQK